MPEYTDQQLLEKLAEVLETWPLYRELAYTGAASTSVLPRLIRLRCLHCGTVQQYSGNIPQGQAHRIGLNQYAYRCRCQQSTVTYYFYWAPGQNKPGSFLKVGQHPPLEEEMNPALEKMLDSEDEKLYKNAIRLRNFNMGIGAVAYMRRIVENKMNDILDLVAELSEDVDLVSATESDPTSENESPSKHDPAAELADIKRGPFSAKVDFAAALMPHHLLRAGAPNPISILHSLTSEGLHARSEEECVDIFDRCKLTFEYLFANLRPSTQQARAYHQSLAALTKRQPAQKDR